MNNTYTCHIEGKITKVMSCSVEMLLLNLDDGESFILGDYLESDYYIADNKAVIRPSLIFTSSINAVAFEDWTIPDVPAGTEVEIDREVVAVTDDTGLTLNFSASGIWPVTLRPPFPWVESSCEVTVT